MFAWHPSRLPWSDFHARGLLLLSRPKLPIPSNMRPMLGINFESTCVLLEGFRILDKRESEDLQHVFNKVLLHASSIFNSDPDSSIFNIRFDSGV